MFMVASSVVSTILILNYHHRNADTHEMSDWVSFALRSEKRLFRLKPNQKKRNKKKVVQCLKILIINKVKHLTSLIHDCMEELFAFFEGGEISRLHPFNREQWKHSYERPRECRKSTRFHGNIFSFLDKSLPSKDWRKFPSSSLRQRTELCVCYVRG